MNAARRHAILFCIAIAFCSCCVARSFFVRSLHTNRCVQLRPDSRADLNSNSTVLVNVRLSQLELKKVGSDL